MDGLTGALILIFLIALAVLGAAYARTRRRMRALTTQMESFLIGEADAAPFSVREDAMAPIQNAAAELEERVKLAKKREEEANQASEALLADISHQLKTPLAALRLFIEMDAGAHQAEQIEQIERMERLIYALLRLEKLCADGYAFHFSKCDMAELIREAWQGLAPVYPDRQLIVEGNAALRADGKWMVEAFANLFKNACEHTPEGGRVRVSVESTQSSIFISVEDFGGGVPAQALSHLFERFYRVEGRPSGGTGIGLSIVKEIIRRHLGDIYAENTPQGLKMNITLPILNLAKA